MMLRSFAAAILAVLLIGQGASRAEVIYHSSPQGTSVRIDGTSTTHDWAMDGKIIGGKMEFTDAKAGDDVFANLFPGKVAVKVHTLIPVKSLHSKADHAPDIMDHLMQETLKADEFTFIQYDLTEMTLKAKPAGKIYEFDTTGNLAIAGVTNKVSFPVTVTMVSTNLITLKGVAPLKMTDYKIDPPKPNIGLGLMKCGDDIKITLDWTLKTR